MIDDLNTSLLYKTKFHVTDKICMRIPLIGDILNDESDSADSKVNKKRINEQEYFLVLRLLASAPYDLQVQLDDMGIDYMGIDDWQLFQFVFMSLDRKSLSYVFDDMDCDHFEISVNEKTEEIILYNPVTDTVIDRNIASKIAVIIYKLTFTSRTLTRAGNEDAKNYVIEKKRKEMKRLAKKPYKSQLETMIVGAVCSQGFSYTYETVKELTLYQFYVSFNQIVKDKDWDKLMSGIYAGTISSKDLSKDKLTWLLQ